MNPYLPHTEADLREDERSRGFEILRNPVFPLETPGLEPQAQAEFLGLCLSSPVAAA